MRKAAGFITGDGTFFEREEEAVLHEAETRLRVKLSTDFPDLAQEKFFIILSDTIRETGDFIDAFNSVKRTEAKVEVRDEVDDSEPPKAHDSLGHVSSAEEDLTSLLQLPARGLSDVSDVGSGASAKEVPNRREKHGPGVR